MKSLATDRDRRRLIAMIVTKYRIVCSLPALDAEDLLSAVQAWQEILEPIPSEWLNECYKRAMRMHSQKRDGGPFKAADLFAVWTHINASGEYEHSRKTPLQLSDSNERDEQQRQIFYEAVAELIRDRKMERREWTAEDEARFAARKSFLKEQAEEILKTDGGESVH